jgi:hypothetical protein
MAAAKIIKELFYNILAHSNRLYDLDTRYASTVYTRMCTTIETIRLEQSNRESIVTKLQKVTYQSKHPQPKLLLLYVH